ncbi:MAG: acyl-CoA thioesterase [Thermoplasmata archaeon]|nr:acyl-CoA thioesterase [Thermoplasmata archaeon]
MDDVAPRSSAESRSNVVRLTLPTDANFIGNVFGGVILAEIDRVAYVTASRHARQNCVTASFDRVDFLEPVHVGELLQLYAELTYVGRSSMEVSVDVHSEDITGRTRRRVGHAYVTMVAVGADGRPTEVPPLAQPTAADMQKFRDGERRMQERRRTRPSVPGPN